MNLHGECFLSVVATSSNAWSKAGFFGLPKSSVGFITLSQKKRKSMQRKHSLLTCDKVGQGRFIWSSVDSIWLWEVYNHCVYGLSLKMAAQPLKSTMADCWRYERLSRTRKLMKRCLVSSCQCPSICPWFQWLLCVVVTLKWLINILIFQIWISSFAQHEKKYFAGKKYRSDN